jgi:hypothetical protein
MGGALKADKLGLRQSRLGGVVSGYDLATGGTKLKSPAIAARLL